MIGNEGEVLQPRNSSSQASNGGSFSFDVGRFHWMVRKPRWRWGRASR